jgi:hypothetical protein
MNLTHRTHKKRGSSYLMSNKAKHVPKEQAKTSKPVYPKDFADAMFGIFTKKDIKI